MSRLHKDHQITTTHLFFARAKPIRFNCMKQKPLIMESVDFELLEHHIYCIYFSAFIKNPPFWWGTEEMRPVWAGRSWIILVGRLRNSEPPLMIEKGCGQVQVRRQTFPTREESYKRIMLVGQSRHKGGVQKSMMIRKGLRTSSGPKTHLTYKRGL